MRVREGVALWALAFVASGLIGTHGIAYWDAGDYVLLAITGGKSGLLLGRPLFLWTSRAVLRAGVDPAHAEMVLRWFWSAVGAIAAPAIASLAARLGMERRACLAAGAALAVSPSFAHTSHQVLTDAPALALSIVALTCAAAGRAWLSGLVIAAAIATRETAAIHLVAIVLLLGRVGAAKALTSAAAVLLAIVLIDRPPGIAAWFGAMSQSVTAQSWSWRDLMMALVWVFAAGPLPVAVGIVTMMRMPLPRAIRFVTVPAAIATIALLFYPDGAFSPRYMLAVVPVAFFLPAAPWMAARRRLTMAALMAALVAGAIGARPADTVAAYGSTFTSRVPQLPPRAVVVPGHFCPQARLAAAIAGRTDLQFVCPGWDWPADLAARLDAGLRDTRPVAVDLGDAAWVGPRETAPKTAVRAWSAAHPSEAVSGFTVVSR